MGPGAEPSSWLDGAPGAGRCAAAPGPRRVLSKLRQTPRFIQAARDNIKDPPGIFIKVGIETVRGALTFIERDRRAQKSTGRAPDGTRSR